MCANGCGLHEGSPTISSTHSPLSTPVGLNTRQRTAHLHSDHCVTFFSDLGSSIHQRMLKVPTYLPTYFSVPWLYRLRNLPTLLPTSTPRQPLVNLPTYLLQQSSNSFVESRSRIRPSGSCGGDVCWLVLAHPAA